jgi:hypothetical protein
MSVFIHFPHFDLFEFTRILIGSKDNDLAYTAGLGFATVGEAFLIL